MIGTCCLQCQVCEKCNEMLFPHTSNYCPLQPSQLHQLCLPEIRSDKQNQKHRKNQLKTHFIQALLHSNERPLFTVSAGVIGSLPLCCQKQAPRASLFLIPFSSFVLFFSLSPACASFPKVSGVETKNVSHSSLVLIVHIF